MRCHALTHTMQACMVHHIGCGVHMAIGTAKDVRSHSWPLITMLQLQRLLKGKRSAQLSVEGKLDEDLHT